jgi:hypothetical protein
VVNLGHTETTQFSIKNNPSMRDVFLVVLPLEPLRTLARARKF